MPLAYALLDGCEPLVPIAAPPTRVPPGPLHVLEPDHETLPATAGLDAHAMDHIPGEDMPAVARAAHEVVEEAMNAGVWVFGAGLENQRASIVASDGTVTDGPYPEAIGGFCVVDVPSREEAAQGAAKHADACRCAEGVREVTPDPARGN